MNSTTQVERVSISNRWENMKALGWRYIDCTRDLYKSSIRILSSFSPISKICSGVSQNLTFIVGGIGIVQSVFIVPQAYNTIKDTIGVANAYFKKQNEEKERKPVKKIDPLRVTKLNSPAKKAADDATKKSEQSLCKKVWKKIQVKDPEKMKDSVEGFAGNVANVCLTGSGFFYAMNDLSLITVPAISVIPVVSLIGGGLVGVLTTLQAINVFKGIALSRKLNSIMKGMEHGKSYEAVDKALLHLYQNENGKVRNKRWFRLRGLTKKDWDSVGELANTLYHDDKASESDKAKAYTDAYVLIKNAQKRLRIYRTVEVVAIVASVLGLTILGILVIGSMAGCPFTAPILIAVAVIGATAAILSVGVLVAKFTVLRAPDDPTMIQAPSFDIKTLSYTSAISTAQESKEITWVMGDYIAVNGLYSSYDKQDRLDEVMETVVAMENSKVRAFEQEKNIEERTRMQKRCACVDDIQFSTGFRKYRLAVKLLLSDAKSNVERLPSLSHINSYRPKRLRWDAVQSAVVEA